MVVSWKTIVASILCPVCFGAVETIKHLFASCLDFIDIWSLFAIWWGFYLPGHIYVQSLFSCYDSVMLRRCQRMIFDAVILTMFWSIWNFRNTRLYGTVPLKKYFLFDGVVDKAFFWVFNRCYKTKLGWTAWLHNLTLTYILI